AVRLCQLGDLAANEARQHPASDRFRHRRRDVRQHLSLRDLSAHSRSDQAGRAGRVAGLLAALLKLLRMSPGAEGTGSRLLNLHPAMIEELPSAAPPLAYGTVLQNAEPSAPHRAHP